MLGASDGVPLNVAEGGTDGAPVLLLLHGLAARWQAFSPVIPRLWDTTHMIAPDFRGHGRSGNAPGTYTLPRLVEDTREILGALEQAGPLTVFGHSLGGWVALLLAAEDPDLVSGVIVGDTAIDPTSVDPDFTVNYMSNVGVALRSVGTALQQLDEGVIEAFRDEALTAGYVPEKLLQQVRCPVLLLQADAEEGGLMKDSDVAMARTHLADVRHHHLPGVGHGLHIQDPYMVMELLTPFLETVTATA